MTPTGQKVTKPAHLGQYKQQPNHVLQPDGKLRRYVEPLQVGSETEDLEQ
jgi:hypothetical protein